MHKLISWYNKNRKKFWYGVVFVIIMWALSSKILEGIFQNTQSIIVANNNIDNISSQLNSIKIDTDKSVLTGKSVEIKQEEVSILDRFISYCNSQNIQEAYKLISDECKSELYPTINEFQQNYYRKFFGGAKKTVKVDIWVNNIYKLDIREDALSTGKYSNSANHRDYITLTKNSNGDTKLNIGGYIKRKVINQTLSVKNIEITLIQQDSYMDYEYYTIGVKNNTGSKIAIADVEDENSTYLLDKSNLKYPAYLNEYSQEQLNVDANKSKKIKIKYFNTFNSTREITNFVLQKIIPNYEIYEKEKNISNIQKLNFEF